MSYIPENEAVFIRINHDARINYIDKLVGLLQNSNKKTMIEYYEIFLSGVLSAYVTDGGISASEWDIYQTKVDKIVKQKKEKLSGK